MIRYDPTLVELTSNFCVYMYVQTWKFIYKSIDSGWSLARIFMTERVKDWNNAIRTIIQMADLFILFLHRSR